MKKYKGIVRATMGVLLLSAAIVAFFLQAQTARANTPNVVIIAKWGFDSNLGRSCAMFPYGAYNIDTMVRDSLGWEWQPGWEPAALKAGAVIIRSNVQHFKDQPESNDPALRNSWCNANNKFYYHLRNSKLQGWRQGLGGTDRGIGGNKPVNQVTRTMGEVMLDGGNLPEYVFRPCLQNQTQTLALQGLNYQQILQDSSIYGQPCDPNIPSHTNLSFNTTYYTFIKSLTNGTAPYLDFNNPPQWCLNCAEPTLSTTIPTLGSRSNTSTAEGLSRQAEVYWGFIRLDRAEADTEFGNLNNYAKGYVRGAKGEYLMSFGGHTNTIRISGIDDRPSSVQANVYVGGIYKFSMLWQAGDNARRQINQSLGQYNAGSYPVAIEFAWDCQWPWNPNVPNPQPGTCPNPNNFNGTPGNCPVGYPPGIYDCDRNLYLDNFLITTP